MNANGYRICYGIFEWGSWGSIESGLYYEFLPNEYKPSKGITKPNNWIMESHGCPVSGYRRVCIAWNPQGQIGISVCNSLDNFVKATARNKAVGRLKAFEAHQLNWRMGMNPPYMVYDQSLPINRCWKPIGDYVQAQIAKEKEDAVSNHS